MAPSGLVNGEGTLGVAFDDAQIAIAWRDARWHAVSMACDGSPAAVAAAIVALAPDAPTGSVVRVALLRPVAQMRTLRFPRMARATLETLLARDWSRHIVGQRAVAHVAAVHPLDGDQWLAAFAPSDVLESLADAADAQGWKTVDVSTADDALAGAARMLAPDDVRGGECTIVLCDATGATHAVHVRGGVPWVGRRFLAGAMAADVATFARASVVSAVSRAHLVLIGHGTHTAGLARTLGADGARARAVDPGLPPDASSVELFAVARAMSAPALHLVAPRAQLTRARGMRATTWWLVAATAAALLAGLGIERWQVQRDLAAVQQARAEIAAPVRNAMALRSDVEAAAEITGMLAEREAAASRVSGAMAAVALALPEGTTLTALRISGDSVMVEGESARSAAVYDSLRGVALLERVALAAPLRQERQTGDVVVEHFAFSARLRRTAAPPAGSQ